MYHGSPNSFTAFDKKKAKASGLYGKGFYFTDSESSSNSRGSNNSNNALHDDTASNTRLSQKDTSVNADSMQNSQEDAPKKVESRKDVDNSVQSQEFKNWFGDWQNDSENASMVVNALNPAVLQCPALPLRKQKWDIPGLKINKDLMN